MKNIFQGHIVFGKKTLQFGMSGEIIGPNFFENDDGVVVTYSCKCYRSMLQDFLARSG